MNKGNIIFIRHGESRANVEERFYADDRINFLSLNGEQQVHGVGATMQQTAFDVDVLICSEMNRARQTAAIIDQYLVCDPRVIIDPNLNEWSPHNYSIYDSTYPPIPRDSHRDHARIALDNILSLANSGNRVLVASHYYSMVHMFEILTGLDEEGLRDHIGGYIPNAYPLVWCDEEKTLNRLCDTLYPFPDQTGWVTAKPAAPGDVDYKITIKV